MNESSRYTRQIVLPNIGEHGQKKLQEAKVFVVGCGGLGCALLPYLVASGIGTIGIIDGDRVSPSNLHRQVLFSENDIDQFKVDVAKKSLQKLNSATNIKTIKAYLDGDNALDLFKEYDLIVDATDRIEARYLINDACILTSRSFVHASIYRFQSQVSVFNYRNGPTYRCLYPIPPKEVKSCAEAGILGSTVAMVAGLQSNEVMKIILNIGEVLSGKLLLTDHLTNTVNKINFKRGEVNVSHESFKKDHRINFVNYTEYEVLDHLLIDLRSENEVPILTSENLIQIPLHALESSLKSLPSERDILLFCASGQRSQKAYKILTESGFTRVYCLKENAAEIKLKLEA